MKINITIITLLISLISFAQESGKETTCIELLPVDTTIVTHSEWTRNNYKKRLKEFMQMPIRSGDIVMMGNSLTQVGGNWNKRLNLNNVVNRGIGGDITDGLQARLPEVICSKPSKVFILIGTNDVLWTESSPAIIAEKIISIAKAVTSEVDGVQTYVQTVLPINSTWKKKLVDHNAINQKIKAINDILLKAEGESYQLIDLNLLMSDSNGFLREDLSTDGVHLNEAGYRIWTDILKITIGK